MKKYYVYIHTCNANGKRYVGCTVKIKPEYRWGRNGNRYQYNECFYSDILKYGWDNITHEVFEVDSKEEMYRKEIELISFYHTNDPRYGYNHSVGGEKGALGCKRSEEHKKHLSEVNKKRYSDHPEFRKRVSETQKEKWTDPEFREKMSKALKGKTRSGETRRKMSEAQKGKPKPKIKIQLPDETIVEITKQALTRWYVNKGKKFEYIS